MSLDSLVSAAAGNDLKFVFVGGKGGVGKTTSSSAIATLLATVCQKRVLLVSTDPAHSLGDAWRSSFSNVPKQAELATTNGSGSLEIMELDPNESMQDELKHWSSISQELFGSAEEDKSSEEWNSKIHQFQEWLSGIPGMDEATALSNAIKHIESGKYDIIVFDTAPTGHTLKLLALPAILEQGIDQLQSWQTTFWSYWQVLKSGGSSNASSLKEQVKDKLTRYKTNIQKVAKMLQDPTRTRFVVVCIAEFLSVSETQRLLQELAHHKVVASHVIVNQLVVQDALNAEELSDLESLAEVGQLNLPQALLQKTVHACRLTTARKAIQQRYLKELKEHSSAQSLEGICEVPLLAEEVTGPQAIQRFAQFLVQDTEKLAVTNPTRNSGGKLYGDLEQEAATLVYHPGDLVKVVGLKSSPQFNDIQGNVTTPPQADTGRYGVAIQFKGKTKTLALRPQNMILLGRSSKKSRPNESSAATTTTAAGESTSSSSSAGNSDAGPSIMSKAKKVLEDPEIKAMIAQNPDLQTAVEDCLTSPMNVMKYLGNPEMGPFISKVMAKL